MKALSLTEILVISLIGLAALALVIVLYRREMKKPKRRNSNSWNESQEEISRWNNDTHN